MPTVDLSEVDTFSSLMADLTDSMFADIVREFNNSSGYDLATQQRWMSEAVPEIWTPRAVAANDLAADWYQRSGSNLAFDVITSLVPSPKTIAGQVAWSFTQVAVLHALTAVAQRDLLGQARRTIVANATREAGAKWARHAKPNACRYCQMLATRGPVYASKKLAAHDGYKSPPKSRFHKHCHCVAVPVRPGMSYSPPEYVERWSADYEEAVSIAGGERNSQSVMAAYRLMDSAK
ncbi:VG15 protein [Nocardia goodfellowii]